MTSQTKPKMIKYTEANIRITGPGWDVEQRKRVILVKGYKGGAYAMAQM